MSGWRDKGEVRLPNPDSKIRTAYDAKTGYLAVVFLELDTRRYGLWYQPDGWVTPDGGLPYGDRKLTDWDIAIHDGMVKLIGVTWRDDEPDAHPNLLFQDLYRVS